VQPILRTLVNVVLTRNGSQYTNDLVSPTGLPMLYPQEDEDEAYCSDAGDGLGCTIDSDCACVAATGQLDEQNTVLKGS
jgi:hypothetical protein